MKKNNLLLLLLSTLIISCGESTNSQSKSNNNSTSTGVLTSSSTSTNKDSSTTSSNIVTSSSSSTPKEESIIEIVMMGDVYKDSMRSAYAIIKEGYESDVAWESSDPSVVKVSPRDITTDCSVIGVGYGTATITATLVNTPEHKATFVVTIAEGEAMPADLFNKVTGGVKLESIDKCFSYDDKLNETLDFQYAVTTIYEETKPNDKSNENTTDAYQISVIDLDKNKETYAANYVRGTGGYVSTESLDMNNQIQTKKFTSVDYEDGIKWEYSYYVNLWANEEYVTNEMFRTFDGGKTYHYTSYYLSATYLCASMYMEDISPDDMYFTYENDVLRLHIEVDPYNSDEFASTTYGRKIMTTFKEFDTAKVSHPTPFEHKDYHDDLDAAKERLATIKNYTVDVTLDYPGTGSDVAYKFILTEDTIDQTILKNGEIISHTGAHKKDASSYFEYSYNDATSKLVIGNQHDSTWESVNRYPTFDFASEIFSEVSTGSYITQGNYGLLMYRCIFLSAAFSYYTFDDAVAMIIDENGNIESLSTTLDALGERLVLTAKFSKIGTSTCDIDFEQDVDINVSGSFEEAAKNVYNSLVEWGIESVVPYLYCKVNYSSVAYAKPRDENGFAYDGVAYVYLSTNTFSTEEDRDQFINDYIELLLSLGYKDSGTTEKQTGFKLYTKGEYSIGVGIKPNWNGNPSKAVQIIVVSDNLAVPSDY